MKNERRRGHPDSKYKYETQDEYMKASALAIHVLKGQLKDQGFEMDSKDFQNTYTRLRKFYKHQFKDEDSFLNAKEIMKRAGIKYINKELGL